MRVHKYKNDMYIEVIDEEFNLKEINKYKSRFEELRRKLEIREESEFYSERWIYKVGGIEKSIVFPDEILTKRIANKYNKSYEYINVGFRYFMLEKMTEITTARDLCLLLKQILKIGVENLLKVGSNEIQLKYYRGIIDFFLFLDLGDIDDIENIIDNILTREQKRRNSYKSKNIPNFDSIFAFTEIINMFMKNATIEELKEYYPVILWWNITTILPLRPSEFLKTPFDCIDIDDNNYILKIKRSILKSKSKIGDISKMENCYIDEIVSIDKSLYECIQEYQKFININMSNCKKDFLIPIEFVKESNTPRIINQENFTSNDLYHKVNKFYNIIVIIKMGIGVKGSLLINKNGIQEVIEKLTPYDTRHIAIINLMLMGNDPYVVMQLAGHESINVTFGYYEHIKDYTKALSIYYSRKKTVFESEKLMIIKSKSASHRNDWEYLSSNIPQIKESYHNVDGGRCKYKDLEYDITPCFKVEGIHSMCPYFVPDNKDDCERSAMRVLNRIDNKIKVLQDLVANGSKNINFLEKNAIGIEELRNEITLLCSISKSMYDEDALY